jgi:hypothetical protein
MSIQDKILKLWMDGKQGSEIAAKLRITRNSVMGYLYRMRKKGLIEYKDPVVIDKINKGQTPTRVPRAKKPYRSPYEQLKIPFPLPPKTGGITLMELTSNSCRYVINDGLPAQFRFCGAPKKTGTYCEEHHKICYYTPAKSDRKKFVRKKVTLAGIPVFTGDYRA